MINHIKDIYKSEDLNGEFLVQPLKIYHSFFAKKIENRSGLKKVAWVVTNVATGIFDYPLLGLLASIGILVKLTGIPSLKMHNQSGKNRINIIQSGIKDSSGYVSDFSSSIIQSGWQMSAIKEFKITKQNVDEISIIIKQEIDSLSNQFKKIYISSNGPIKNCHDEITVLLRVKQRINYN